MKYFKILYVLGALSITFLFCHSQGFAHSWMAPENEAKKKNVIPFSRESANKGQLLFKDLCAHCHGSKANGLGKDETGLSKDTPNLSIRLKNHSDGDFHWKIINGKGDMPSFKDEVSEDEVWNIINYIKALER